MIELMVPKKMAPMTGLAARVYHTSDGGKTVTVVEVPKSKDAFEVLALVERQYPREPEEVLARRWSETIGARRARPAPEPEGAEVNPNRRPEESVPDLLDDSMTTAAEAAISTRAALPPRKPDETPSPPSAARVAPRRGVRDTSMIAYRVLQYTGKIGDQQRMIIDAILASPASGWTRKELEEQTGLPINAVTGRVHELLNAPFNLLIERGKKTCFVTKNEVNAIWLATTEEETV